jgi:hypothetical protein
MRLWFARGSEVSIRKQLVTQVVLGILSDDLAPASTLDEKTRPRVHLHANTINADRNQPQ